MARDFFSSVRGIKIGDIALIMGDGAPATVLSGQTIPNGTLYINAADWSVHKYETDTWVQKGSGITTAADLAYDNSGSGLTATEIQSAIDELKVLVDAGGGGGSGIAGTWDVTPTIGPASDPDVFSTNKATYDTGTDDMTSVFTLSGSPEVANVVFDDPFAHNSGGTSYVLSATYPAVPDEPGATAYVILGYTDNPATVEADLVAALTSSPTTANTFLCSGMGTSDGTNYAFGTLYNKVNGTVDGSPASGAFPNPQPGDRIDCYLDNTNNQLITVIGEESTTGALAAAPDGDTLYPFVGFLIASAVANYQGFIVGARFREAPLTYNGVQFEPMGTPETITQVSSLPVGAAVDSLYIIDVDTVTDPNIKEWMAEPFGLKVRKNDIIRIVNNTGGSEEIDLFNENEGVDSTTNTVFSPFEPLSYTQFINGGGTIDPDGPIYPDVTETSGKFDVSYPAALLPDDSITFSMAVYADEYQVTDSSKKYRFETDNPAVQTSPQSLTIDTTSGSREFVFTAWEDGRTGYQTKTRPLESSLTRLVNFGAVGSVVSNFDGPIFIEEIGYVFTVDTVVGLAVGDTLDINSFYGSEELMIVDITGNDVKARVSSVGFEEDDVNTLENGTDTQLTNQSGTTVNISSFTRYGIFDKPATVTEVGATLYYNNLGLFDGSNIGSLVQTVGTPGSFTTLDELQEAASAPGAQVYTLYAYAGKRGIAANGSFPIYSDEIGVYINYDPGTSETLQITIHPNYLGEEIDFTQEIATDIDYANGSVSFTFALVGGGEKTYTLDQATLTDFISQLDGAGLLGSFVTQDITSTGDNNGGAGYVVSTDFLLAYTRVYAWNGDADMDGTQKVLLQGGGVDYTHTSGNLSIVSDTYDYYRIEGLQLLYNDGVDNIPIILDKLTTDPTFSNTIVSDVFSGLNSNPSYLSYVGSYEKTLNVGGAAFVRADTGNISPLGIDKVVYNDSNGTFHVVPGNFDPTLGAEMSYQYPNSLQYVSKTGKFNGKKFIEGMYARWNGVETLPFPNFENYVAAPENQLKIFFDPSAAASSETNLVFTTFEAAHEFAAQKISSGEYKKVVIAIDYNAMFDAIGPYYTLEEKTYNMTGISFEAIGRARFPYNIVEGYFRTTGTTNDVTFLYEDVQKIGGTGGSTSYIVDLRDFRIRSDSNDFHISFVDTTDPLVNASPTASPVRMLINENTYIRGNEIFNMDATDSPSGIDIFCTGGAIDGDGWYLQSPYDIRLYLLSGYTRFGRIHNPSVGSNNLIIYDFVGQTENYDWQGAVGYSDAVANSWVGSINIDSSVGRDISVIGRHSLNNASERVVPNDNLFLNNVSGSCTLYLPTHSNARITGGEKCTVWIESIAGGGSLTIDAGAGYTIDFDGTGAQTLVIPDTDSNVKLEFVLVSGSIWWVKKT